MGQTNVLQGMNTYKVMQKHFDSEKAASCVGGGGGGKRGLATGVELKCVPVADSKSKVETLELWGEGRLKLPYFVMQVRWTKFNTSWVCMLIMQFAPLLPQPGQVFIVHYVRVKAHLSLVFEQFCADDAVHEVRSVPDYCQSSTAVPPVSLASWNSAQSS